jgi:hypothetical protein
MALLQSTEIAQAIAKCEGSFSTAETREGSNAASKLLFSNEASAFQNVKALKSSVVQPTKAMLQKKSLISLANNKTAAHTGSIGDSFTQDIVYVQKSAPFKVSYKLAENNSFGYDEQLQQGFLNAFMSLRGGINAYALAQLAAQKTQVASTSTLLTWGAVGNKYTNASGEANVSKQASRIKAAARKNKYSGSLDIVGGQQLVSDMVHNAAQGTANATNFGYQFSGLSLAEEENIDEANLGANGFGYFLPSGLVGMTSWNEAINTSGRGDVNANEGLFTTISDPVIPNLMYDVHVYRGLANTVSGDNTHYQDPIDQYEVTAFYSFSHAMIDVANETPIFAIEQL